MKTAAKPPELTDWERGFVAGYLNACARRVGLADQVSTLPKRFRPFARALLEGRH